MCPTIWAICKAPSPRAPAEPFKDLPRIFQAPSARLLSNTPSVKENTMRRRSLAHLRPVRDVDTPSLQFRTIHGYRRAFRVAGSGPALLLIHGVGDSSTTWETVHAKLAQRFTVIAPDLLGHGESDKPRADYSLAAFANGMRDLLSVLGIDRVTVVGHSLGGGIAMQFAYQYPQFVERIVLVSSGGVTKDVSFALRLAALPMGSEALAMLRVPGALPAVQLAGRAAGKILGSTKFGRDLPDGLRLFARLREPAALSAFSRTLRAVVDGRGQLVTMLDRSYLMQCMPLQLIWGEDDLVIPVSHARIAHAAVPGSRLEIFKHSGHMPFHDHPDRFVEIVERFVDSTEPAEYDRDLLRSLLLGIRQTGPGSVDPASRGA
jgi:pimeloyl-ACP methyl ester carboxylesterase